MSNFEVKYKMRKILLLCLLLSITGCKIQKPKYYLDNLKEGEKIIIEGNFNTYLENGISYYNLLDAKIL